MTEPVSFLTELKQRNVIRVATAYLVAAWLIVQLVDTLATAFRFGDAAVRTTVIVLAIGFDSKILRFVFLQPALLQEIRNWYLWTYRPLLFND